MSTPAREELRDLILHRLPEARARELEDRLMLEEDSAEKLEDATHDLLDDYARGRLPAPERAAVERYLLAARENRWKAAIAKGIAQRIPARASPPRGRAPIRTWAIGALIAACGVVVAILVARFPLGSRRPPAVQTTAASRSEPAGGAISATVTLLADASRGGSVRNVVVPADATLVRVQAEVSDAPQGHYRLVLSGPEGRVRFSVGHLVPQVAGAYHYVETDVPVRALAPEAHVLVVPEDSGAQGSGSFSWDIRLSH